MRTITSYYSTTKYEIFGMEDDAHHIADSIGNRRFGSSAIPLTEQSQKSPSLPAILLNNSTHPNLHAQFDRPQQANRQQLMKTVPWFTAPITFKCRPNLIDMHLRFFIQIFAEKVNGRCATMQLFSPKRWEGNFSLPEYFEVKNSWRAANLWRWRNESSRTPP